MAHKLKTERVNAGVIAECTGESCTWSGKHRYKKGVGERPNRTYIDAEDPVFPNRQLAVEAHKAFHSAKE
jgi:hypothetical protein